MPKSGYNDNKHVDADGIRLAPPPIAGAEAHVLPSVYQEFVIQPSIEISSAAAAEAPAEIATDRDFQPKKKDVTKRWKRTRRGRNFVSGIIMFVISFFVVLPYILGIFDAVVYMPFKYNLTEFNAIGNIVDAIGQSAALNWSGAQVNSIWLNCVPDLILAAGVILLLVNMVKSVAAMCGALKPMKFVWCSVGYLVCVLAVFVASLVGAEVIGIHKIDFMADFVRAYKTGELFMLVTFALGNLLFSAVAAFINKDKSGYLG